MDRYAAEAGFSAAYCFPAVPEDGAPETIRTLALLPMAYLPGGRLMDRFYPASNRAYHAVKKLAERIAADWGITALALGRLRVKPMCARVPAFGVGRNTLSYLPRVGSRFCLEVLGLSVPVEDAKLSVYPRELLPCAECGACARACPTGAIAADGFVKERCLRFHMMSGKPVPPEMRGLMGGEGGARGILGCDICQRACPANAESEKRRDETDAFTLEELLRCDARTLDAFAALYGRNYANRNRIVAQAVLAAANGGRRDLLPQIEALKNSPSPAVAEHADWAAQKLRGEKNPCEDAEE